MGKIKFKHKLFISITILVTFIVTTGSFLYYIISVGNLTKTEFENSKIISERISNQIDDLYNQMDIAVNSLINNPQLKNALYFLNHSEPSLSELEKIQFNKIIENNLGSILFFHNISNVILYNNNKNYFYYSGYYLKFDDYVEDSLSNNDYISRLSNNNSSVKLPPHSNPWKNNSVPVISVFKNFSNNISMHDTIVEAQVPYSVLENICNQEGFGNDKGIIIFDKDFNLIYPFSDIQENLDYNSIESIKSGLKNNIMQDYKDNFTYTSIKSEYTDFHVVLLSNNNHIKVQKNQYLFSAIIFSLFMLSAILFILLFLINKLLTPLNELIQHINSISLDNKTKLCIKEDSFDEFKAINDSFNQMVLKLKDSIEVAYKAEIGEVNANLAALQSQINPHFLYNTLNAISAASEIYGSEITSKMCQELSFMLRYVTSNSQEAKLIDEINHTKNYLELMKISNEGNFNYSIDIPIESYDFIIPKLTIQPLVENCFKHGFKNTLPPWDIKISCTITENKFKIIIKDNGGGFDDTLLMDFNKFFKEHKFEECKEIYKSLTIGGLGLKNIYSRLVLLYKNDVKFKIINDNGCEITIERVFEID